MSWPVRASRAVYENAWIRVREDEVVRPDGRDGVYGVVELRHPAVIVIAMTDDDEVLLVDLDRHTVGRTLELPAGGSDGELFLDAARRELLEETGYTASSWRELLPMSMLNGVAVAEVRPFLATGLQRVVDGDLSSQREEGIAAVRTIAWSEVLRMIGTGEIDDGESVAALFRAALELGRVS